MNVVDYKEATPLNVRIHVEVLKIWERVCVRAVKQYGLQWRVERVQGQTLLRGAIDERYDGGI